MLCSKNVDLLLALEFLVFPLGPDGIYTPYLQPGVFVYNGSNKREVLCSRLYCGPMQNIYGRQVRWSGICLPCVHMPGSCGKSLDGLGKG